MSLENEYITFKKELESDKRKLAEAKAIVVAPDENNDLTIEERTEAKNRAIKSIESRIEETEEILEEIKSELKEFIANGGEVSETTLKELEESEDDESSDSTYFDDETNDFESFEVKFKIEDNIAPVYIEGYVEINDEDAEDVDWHFWTGTEYSSQMKIFHDKEEITGLTDAQQQEIWAFEDHYLMNDALWIDNMILQSEEGENRTYVREFCTLIINEGAKMECEIVPVRDYIVEVIPKFNGEKLNLTEYMLEVYEEFDPWYAQDNMSSVEDGHIFFEMSKEYFEEDDSVKSSLMEDVNEEARRIYARALTREMGIYSRYGENIEQQMDGTYDNDWLFKMSQHENDLEEELDDFLREEGFIDEEL